MSQPSDSEEDSEKDKDQTPVTNLLPSSYPTTVTFASAANSSFQPISFSISTHMSGPTGYGYVGYNPSVYPSSFSFTTNTNNNTNRTYPHGNWTTDFTGFKFSNDQIVGLRSWKFEHGFLLPMNASKQAWKPGINQGFHWDAQYKIKDEVVNNPNMKMAYVSFPLDYETFFVRREQECQFENCTCGFYAYWDGSNDYAAATGIHSGVKAYESVTGIIRAFGKVVVGERGFRAKRARIEALLVPDGFELDSMYDDTPQFSDLETMLSEFPLTKAEKEDDDEGKGRE